MAKSNNKQKTPTTAQRLASIVKSCRDIMRKDKGLNGDTDRLPMLTWVMFLKFLDDKEKAREEDAILDGKEYRPIIEYPYRWRDWAAPADGITGDELLAFINNDEVPHPLGEMNEKGKPVRVPGLFKYLRSIPDHPDIPQRSVIRNVFRDTLNRMINGYLIRDVLNTINEIHFDSTDDIHTLSALYESMLKEMRDAAGDSGEFYTPRPVVQFIVEVMNPQLSEVILDPACGTGGFLVEAYQHLEKQVQSTEDYRKLQDKSIRGGEAKSLPYLLCQMNLLLHGMEAPDITYGNSLATPLREIGDAQRVDIIMTNPPFGGEEEAGIKDNFPADKQTAETALLFLQLIMRKLGRGDRAGRAAVIVPNGTLFNDGVTGRIKEQLLTEYNLHTIIRLPNGVFEPYTKIPTNILFFERRGKTSKVWYYEVALPKGYKNFTKTKPMRYEDFIACLEWWNNREENDQAWCVSVDDILKYDEDGQLLSANLDINNPNAEDPFSYPHPIELVSSIRAKDDSIRDLLQTTYEIIQGGNGSAFSLEQYPKIEIRKFAKLVKRPAELFGDVESIGVKWWGKGAYIAEVKPASKFRAARFEVKANDLIYNDMWARHGSVAIVPPELDGCVASAHFPTWEIDLDRFYPPFLQWCFRSPWFWRECSERSQGSTGRNAISKTLFRTIPMPMPPLDIQKQMVLQLEKLSEVVGKLLELQNQTTKDMEALLGSVLDEGLPEGL